MLKNLFAKLIVAFAVALIACTPAMAQSGKPDLIVKKIEIDADDNEIKVEAENIGDEKAGPFAVRLDIRVGQRVIFTQTKTIDKLGKNDDKKVKFDVNFAQLRIAADRLPRFFRNLPLRAVATVDANRQVNEANEANNTLTRNLP